MTSVFDGDVRCWVAREYDPNKVVPPGGTLIAPGTHAGVVLNSGINDIDVFGCNGTQPSALTHKTLKNGVWSGWSVLSGKCLYSPGAVSRIPEAISVYTIGTDYGVWHTISAWGYAKWEKLGGNSHHGVECCSISPNREDIFITDYPTGHVFQRYFTTGNAWSKWISLGSPNNAYANSGPGACKYGDNLQAVYVQGNDGKTWGIYSDGKSWSKWINHGGPKVESTNHPSACGFNGKIYLFITTESDKIAYNIYNGNSWAGWITENVIMTCSPEVQITPDGKTVHYFARGNDKAIWHRTMNTTTKLWSNWESIGGNFP